MHYRAELRRQLMRFDELASYGLFSAQVDARRSLFQAMGRLPLWLPQFIST